MRQTIGKHWMKDEVLFDERVVREGDPEHLAQLALTHYQRRASLPSDK
jgi:hypothetical protein